MDISELRDKSSDELSDILLSLREEQFKLRLQHSTEQLGQTHLLKVNKKMIARVKTIQREKMGEPV